MIYIFLVNGKTVDKQNCKFPEALKIAYKLCFMNKADVNIVRSDVVMGRYEYNNGEIKRVNHKKGKSKRN